MRVSIIRDKYSDFSTLGKIEIDGAFQCYSLERALKDPKHPCIPEGLYDMDWYNSPHFNLTVPLLKNVPGRTMIEIHPANYPRDLLGCIAPGVTRGEDAVFQSRSAWASLIGLMHQAKGDIFIEVTHA